MVFGRRRFLMSLAFIFGPSLDKSAPQDRVFIIFSAFVGCIFLVGVLYITDDLARDELRTDDAIAFAVSLDALC